MVVANIVLVVALVSVVCGTVSADVFSVGLPLLDALPRNCGYVLGVREGDTCESLA
jgi:hypothetical protein